MKGLILLKKRLPLTCSAIIIISTFLISCGGNPGKASSPATYDAILTDAAPTITPKINSLTIDKIVIESDKDNDGIKDLVDIVEGARIQVEKKPRYIPDYYKGGYPPENIAVCTDIVSRALKNAGYDLKYLVDNDIKKHISDYPRVEGRPDPNIDFRRVRNLVPFFKKYADILTNKIIPYDMENLKQWQGGDLVVFYWTGNEHIAVVSDKRAENGVPYLIHTYGSYPREDDRLLDWADTIACHFRFPKKSLSINQ